MKLRKFGLLCGLLFVCSFALLLAPANAQYESNYDERESQNQKESRTVSNSSGNSRSQPVKIDIDSTKPETFPIRLRDRNRNELAEFYNSNLGDRGQVFILEYRQDF